MMYTFRERERILDIYDQACGARMTVSYIRYGGVARDLTEDAVRMIEETGPNMNAPKASKP